MQRFKILLILFIIIVFHGLNAEAQNMETIKITELENKDANTILFYEPGYGFILEGKLSTILFFLYESTAFWLKKESIDLGNDPAIKLTARSIGQKDKLIHELIHEIQEKYLIKEVKVEKKDTFWMLTLGNIPHQVFAEIVDPESKQSLAGLEEGKLIYKRKTLKKIVRHLQYYYQRKIACVDPEDTIWSTLVSIEIPNDIFDSLENFTSYFKSIGISTVEKEFEYVEIILSNKS